jgi:hypothetical protein
MGYYLDCLLHACIISPLLEQVHISNMYRQAVVTVVVVQSGCILWIAQLAAGELGFADDPIPSAVFESQSWACLACSLTPAEDQDRSFMNTTMTASGMAERGSTCYLCTHC